MTDEKKDSSFDVEKVDAIVARMKKKYEREGIATDNESPSEALKKLQGTITGTTVVRLQVQPIEDLADETNPFTRLLGQIYLRFKKPLSKIMRVLEKTKTMQELQYWLYSANLRYSAQQWIAMSISLGAFVFVIGLCLTILLGVVLAQNPYLFAAFLLSLPIGLALLSFGAMLVYPRYKAVQRGIAVSTELPFALRHMATEIRAGIGLYRTIQTIAAANYGELSEEFGRVINEVEEGVDTKDALHNLSVRTQSIALRNALRHIIRALKTGGNLSEIISDIAEDVAFSLRESVRDYAAKMNFFGVIFIFAAIVAPVMITVLGAIRNSPIAAFSDTFNVIPLTIPTMIFFFVIALPATLLIFIAYTRAVQPRV